MMHKTILALLIIAFPFILKAQTVKIVSLSELKTYYEVRNDTTYVVNFWATWCRPCLEELPLFEQINSYYTDKKEAGKRDDKVPPSGRTMSSGHRASIAEGRGAVSVLLVSLDFPEQVSKLKKFLTKNKIRSKVVLLDEPDENTWIPQINEKWTGSIPATLIINNAKNYTFFHEGKITLEELKNAIP